MGAGRFKVPSLRGQKRQSAQEAKALGLELREAVKRHDPETARTLIYRGANVNAVPFIGALRALAFPSGDGDGADDKAPIGQRCRSPFRNTSHDLGCTNRPHRHRETSLRLRRKSQQC